MKWERIEIHIEHLFPGLLILSLLLLLLPVSPPNSEESNLGLEIIQRDFILPTLFIACSYILGVIAALISRIIIDKFADLFLSPLLFGHVAGRYLKDRAPTGKQAILDAYDDALAFAITNEKEESYRQNVQRRRERAGLVRTCYVPLALAIAIFLQGKFEIPLFFNLVIGFTLALIIVVPLFAYAESLIYGDCLKHQRYHPILVEPNNSENPE